MHLLSAETLSPPNLPEKVYSFPHVDHLMLELPEVGGVGWVTYQCSEWCIQFPYRAGTQKQESKQVAFAGTTCSCPSTYPTVETIQKDWTVLPD